ncbi:MAG: hypothetical protein M0P31_02355 [Solirubrobacteraceae bacterium]|nr:hypothetical protein [Solirubrobacteraceae bacterium]
MTDTEALLEVVLVGFLSGVGLIVIFSLTIAETVRAMVARREHRRGTAVLHAAGAAVGGVLCVAAVVLALTLMMHK